MAISIYLNGTTGAQDGTLEVTGDGVGANLYDVDSIATFYLRAASNYKNNELVTVYAPIDCQVSSDGVTYASTCTYAAGVIQDANVACYIKRIAMTQSPTEPQVITQLKTYPHCAYVSVVQIVDTIPPVLTGTLTVTAGAGQVALDWPDATDNSGVTGYDIEYGTTTSYGSSATSVGSNVTITGLTVNTLYYFRVRAFDAAGNKSSWLTASATPVPVFSDDFNRANSLTVGNGWSSFSYWMDSGGVSTPPSEYGIVSNRLSIKTDNTFQANIAIGRSVTTGFLGRLAQIKVGNSAAYLYPNIDVDMGTAGVTGMYRGNGYVLIVGAQTIGQQLLLRKLVSGTPTTILNLTSTVTPVEGDIFGVKRIGNDLVIYRNGLEIGRVTDSTYMANLGYVGLLLSTASGTAGLTNYADDFMIAI